MFTMLRRARPVGSPPARRPRLGFDVLESRDCPSSGWDVPLPISYQPPTQESGPPLDRVAGLVKEGPEIVDFEAEALGDGMYRFTGTVVDDRAGGLPVIFTGGPSIDGTRVTTNADGTFDLTIQLLPTDAGVVTVVAQDGDGHESNRPSVPINP